MNATFSCASFICRSSNIICGMVFDYFSNTIRHMPCYVLLFDRGSAVFAIWRRINRASAIFFDLLFRRRKEVMPNIVARTDRRMRPPFVYGCAGRMGEICRQPERIRFAAHYDDINVLGLVPRSEQGVIRDFGPGGVRFDSRPREWKHKVA